MNVNDLKNQLLEESIRNTGSVNYEYAFLRLIDVLNEYFNVKNEIIED